MADKKTEKYIDLISKNADQEKKEELQFRADEAKHDVDGAILETKKNIAWTLLNG